MPKLVGETCHICLKGVITGTEKNCRTQDSKGDFYATYVLIQSIDIFNMNMESGNE